MRVRSLIWTDRYFLLLVLSPVGWLIVDVLLYRWGGNEALSTAGVPTVLVMVILVLLDSNALARRGIRVSAWWGILLLPPYVVVRTRRARSPWVLPITWVVLVLAYAITAEPALTADSRAP